MAELQFKDENKQLIWQSRAVVVAELLLPRPETSASNLIYISVFLGQYLHKEKTQ